VEHKKDPFDLAKLFGVEHMVTPKTLVSESEREVRRKYPHEVTQDIHALLEEMNMRVLSKDIIGVCNCLDAIKIRVKFLEDTANDIRKAQGK
jgi:hypothetical protein